VVKNRTSLTENLFWRAVVLVLEVQLGEIRLDELKDLRFGRFLLADCIGSFEFLEGSRAVPYLIYVVSKA